MAGDRPRHVPPPPTRYGAVPAIQARPATPVRSGAPPAVVQPFGKGTIGGALLGGAYGFSTAGPLGFVGGVLLGGAGGGVVESLVDWWNRPGGNPQNRQPGNQTQGNGRHSGGNQGNRNGAHQARSTGKKSGPPTTTSGTSRTPIAPTRPNPPPRCNENDDVDPEDYDEALDVITNENQTLRAALVAAKNLTATHKTNCDAYDFDRSKNYIPSPHGGSVSFNIGGGRTQGYNNSQGYFPVAGAPYKEIDVNAGVGVVGNYRLIRADSPVGDYQDWVGYNITHPGGHWIRVWNEAGRYWQNWNGATRTATDLPGHVAGVRPVDPRTPKQRKLVKEGIRVKKLVLRGFQYRVETSVEL